MNTAMLHNVDFASGQIEGAQQSVRRLSDLAGVFTDDAAYQQALANGDQVVYYVYVLYPEPGQGDLAFGSTILMPGQVGSEFFMTKGHRHVRDAACEVYVGLTGEGCLVVRQGDAEPQILPIKPGVAAYSPPGAVHRLVNTGTEPFITFAVWAADSGQDYEAARGRFPLLVSAAEGPSMRPVAAGAVQPR